jgi:signal transduction histidine kinase
MDFAVLPDRARLGGHRREALAVGCGLTAVAMVALLVNEVPTGVLIGLLVAVSAIGSAAGRGVTQQAPSRREMETLVERMEAVALDNERLAAEASQATREVEQSRARIAAGVEWERRRIERDLHDGAQQRLVALRIELELAEDLVRKDPERGADRLKQLERDMDEALEELRSLAHGVCPPLLSDRGVAEALQAVARRSPVPVDFAAHQIGRYAPELEGAVYFCVVEALQNVLKHADARGMTIRLDGRRSELRFSVSDDGANAPGDLMAQGAGITNMRDRLAAVGGRLHIESVVGGGTTVRGEAPTAGLLSG